MGRVNPHQEVGNAILQTASQPANQPKGKQTELHENVSATRAGGIFIREDIELDSDTSTLTGATQTANTWKNGAATGDDNMSLDSSNNSTTRRHGCSTMGSCGDLMPMVQDTPDQMPKFNGDSCDEFWTFKSAFESYTNDPTLTYKRRLNMLLVAYSGDTKPDLRPCLLVSDPQEGYE